MKFKLLILSVLTSVVLLATSVYSANDIKLNVMGIDVTALAKPQIIEGRTMVPVRAIYEGVGAAVEWDSATKTITGTKDNRTVIMQIGSNDITINGITTQMDAQPLIIDGSTFAPARYVAESFGYEVLWDADNRTVNIISDEPDTKLTTNEISTEETTIETTTEETTVETTIETTTDIDISSLNQLMVSQIKSDVKIVSNTYSLGKYLTMSRFNTQYMNDMFESWKGLAKDDTEMQYVNSSIQYYRAMNSICYHLDEKYRIYKNNAVWGDELVNQCKYYKDKFQELGIAYLNAEKVSQVKESTQKLTDFKNEFINYINTKIKS